MAVLGAGFLGHSIGGHLPHPQAYWAYAACQVRITGSPLNPPDATADYLDAHDPIHADVVRHAQALGLLTFPV